MMQARGAVLAARTGAILVVFLAAAAMVAAQEPAPPTAGRALSLEDLQSRLSQVADSAELDAETKARLTELYNQAINFVTTRNQAADTAAKFEQQLAETPSLAQSVGEELSQPPPDPEPDAPEDVPTAVLEQQLAQAEADLAAARRTRDDLNAEPARRAERRKQIPEQLAAARQRLEEAQRQLASLAANGDSEVVFAARRLVAQARVEAVEQEIAALEKEIQTYDARNDLLTQRIVLAQRRVDTLSKQVDAWRTLVNERRQTEAQAAQEQAEAALSGLEAVSPSVLTYAQNLVQENADLVARQTGPEGMLRKIEGVNNTQQELQRQLDTITRQQEEVQTRIAAAGLSDAVGLLLRTYQAELPDLRLLRNQVDARNETIADVQLEMFRLREKRLAQASIQAEVDAQLEGLAELEESQREDVAESLRRLLTNRQDNLDALITSYNEYFNDLVDLNFTQQQLITRVEAFSAYISELILWVRSAPRFSTGDFGIAWQEVQAVLHHSDWSAIPRFYVTDLWNQPVTYLLFLGSFIILLVARLKLPGQFTELGDAAQRRANTSFRPTADATAYTVVMMLVWPYAIWFAGTRLDIAGAGNDLAAAVALSLKWTAAILLSWEIPRQIVRKDGLAERHFDWAARPLAVVRRQLLSMLVLAVPAVMVITLVSSVSNAQPASALSRLLFVGFMLVLMSYAHVFMNPKKGSLFGVLDRRRRGPRSRLWTLWYVLGVGLPFGGAVLSMMGYSYTAGRLSWSLLLTLCFIAAVMAGKGLVLRWLLLERRRLAIEQARRRREALKSRESEDGSDTETELDQELDLERVGAQTQRLIKSAMAFVLVLGVWAIWAEVLPAIGFLNKVELWGTEEKITLAAVLFAGLVGLMTFVAIQNLPGLLEIALLQRLPLASGERFAITTLVRYTITVIGIIWAFTVIGIGWSKVQWLVAALSVGLGFGLQEILANFVSGLILLFERPVRVGDVVTVGGTSGTVSRIRMRATWITDFDRKELVIPNKEFITGQLVNWTLTDSTLRVLIPIRIAYGSDTGKALDILRSIAANHPGVKDDPPPIIVFVGFGDSALNFEFRVYTDFEVFLDVRHELLLAIDRAFRDAGIEIAFPQRDIHVRSIQGALPLRNEGDLSQPG